MEERGELGGSSDEIGLPGTDRCWCMEVHNTILPTLYGFVQACDKKATVVHMSLSL